MRAVDAVDEEARREFAFLRDLNAHEVVVRLSDEIVEHEVGGERIAQSAQVDCPGGFRGRCPRKMQVVDRRNIKHGTWRDYCVAATGKKSWPEKQEPHGPH